MPLTKNLMGEGMPGAQAQALGFPGDEVTGLTAAGTTNADALQLTSGISQIATCASGAGVLLPTSGGFMAVINNGANACLVYPRPGGQINNATATSGSYSVAAGKTALFVSAGSARIIATLST